MCGITGIFLRNGCADRKRLAESARMLSHRGPDHADSYVDGPFGMAHTRLSIIDLGGGDQPLFARDGELVLIANGEIYNFIELRRDLEKQGHRFTTRSDSEVILHAYVALRKGLSEIPARNVRLCTLRQDRPAPDPGARPARHQAAFSGAPGLTVWHLHPKSRPCSVMDPTPPQVNPNGLIEYLQNQFSSGRTTLLEGYERLLPGEAVCIDQGRVHERWRYWSPLEIKPAAIDFDEARETFDRLMETVMRQHMRSDVPFGLFLSGGVDSSILLALLSRYKDEPIRTFSIGFSDTRLADELPQAERLAQPFRQPPHRPSDQPLKRFSTVCPIPSGRPTTSCAIMPACPPSFWRKPPEKSSKSSSRAKVAMRCLPAMGATGPRSWNAGSRASSPQDPAAFAPAAHCAAGGRSAS